MNHCPLSQTCCGRCPECTTVARAVFTSGNQQAWIEWIHTRDSLMFPGVRQSVEPTYVPSPPSFFQRVRNI